MSAITGIYHLENQPVHEEHCQTLMNGLQIYPADDIQTWLHEHVFFGCHAQWITPESVNEQLPHYDHERRLAITADAILDNREELFERLQVEREQMDSIPDSRLILLAYERWEEDAPKYLIGDFAFMIWDERKHLLFGARDFSGARNLYFHKNHQNFAFCSVMSPLMSLPYAGKKLNEQWLAEYLAITAPVDAANCSLTPYSQIEQVPPSHSISVTRDRIAITRYSNAASAAKDKLRLRDEEYIEAFQEVFNKAVTSRMRTYRGVGAHLSGGLDSGAVVSFAAKSLHNQNKSLHTFSYIPPTDFKDFTPKYLLADERPFIQSTVQHIGGIKDYYLDFEGKDSYSDIDDFTDMMEMPYKFFENSFWIQGMFEKAKEEGIGVLLSGTRGNLSISWGYALDYYALLMKRMRWFRLIQELHHYSKNVGGARLRRLPIVVKIAFPIIERMFPSYSYTEPGLINEEFAKKTAVYSKLESYGIGQSGWFSTPNIFEQRNRHFADVFHWNATNTLTAKLSLRYSLWQRDPTNDIRVIRFCLSVPEEQYVRNGLDRALIRRSTKTLLPDQVRLNQRIRGIQGADWVHRIMPQWDSFMKEARQLSTDSDILMYMNGELIKEALLKLEGGARPEYATDPHCRLLMRSLIVYRFIKRFA